jgi:hypothetical protein
VIVPVIVIVKSPSKPEFNLTYVTILDAVVKVIQEVSETPDGGVIDIP